MANKLVLLVQVAVVNDEIGERSCGDDHLGVIPLAL
jgi:hypothetical protein